MNLLRTLMNILLSGVLIVAALYLLSLDAYALHGRLFVGLSKYLLAAALLLMASFAGMIAWAWNSGSIPKPPSSTFGFDPTYVDPVYKGRLLVRYWYIVVAAVVCFVFAVVFANDAPTKSPHPAHLLSISAIGLHSRNGH